jgi:hypothetical protein
MSQGTRINIKEISGNKTRGTNSYSFGNKIENHGEQKS